MKEQQSTEFHVDKNKFTDKKTKRNLKVIPDRCGDH